MGVCVTEGALFISVVLSPSHAIANLASPSSSNSLVSTVFATF